MPPALQSSWEFVTPGSGARLRPQLGVGFWQRSSGAKPGVGANYVSAIEYQLPEAAPARVRSASFQFSGKQSQCVGNEPVVVDVYAYAGDGKADVGDTQAGSRVAQFSANCTDSPAFARPIDVTAIVRQLSVASGIRHVGFNIRKANNRQGPGLFALYPGKLTVVLADHAVAAPPMARAPAATADRRPSPTGSGAGRADASAPLAASKQAQGRCHAVRRRRSDRTGATRRRPAADRPDPALTSRRRAPCALHPFPLVALSALACGTVLAMTGDSVAVPFRGTWVPAKATCDSPLKLVIDANVVTFVNGTQRAEFRKLEQCFTCMGRDVKDMTLLSTDAMGDSPFMITLDGTKKASRA